MNKNYEISIILLTYNPEWEKLRQTLSSILVQDNITYELIIADDGSLQRYDDKIKKICGEFNFVHYKFSNLSINAGTCKNIKKALSLASGRYVKFISPGDFLFDMSICSSWVAFMDETSADITFGDAVYYNVQDKKAKCIRERKSPMQEKLFKNGASRHNLFVDYLLANDTLLGATLLMKIETAKRYIDLFDGLVTYAEDYMVRLAVFENKKILHIPTNVIWYEYGTGISTSKNNRWGELLYKDFVMCNNIIVHNCKALDGISQRYVSYLKGEENNSLLRKIKKCLKFPDVIYWRIANRLGRNYTSVEVDVKQLYKFLN